MTITGIDELANLLIDRAANPEKYAPVNDAVGIAVMNNVDTALAVAFAVLSTPATPSAPTT